MSSFGFRRRSPRTMSPLKFSSAASRSIEGVFLLATGYQSFPYAGRRKPSLDFLSNGRGLFMARLQVGGNRGLVAQVGLRSRRTTSARAMEEYCCAISSAVAPASNAATIVSRVTRVPATRTTASASVRIGTRSIVLAEFTGNTPGSNYTAEAPSDRLGIWPTVAGSG